MLSHRTTSQVATSLCYAHLAPDQRREAVSKLNERPISALTMRLSWRSALDAASYEIDLINGKGGTRPRHYEACYCDIINVINSLCEYIVFVPKRLGFC